MKIKKIREVKPRTVYAVETSTSTFISNGLAHHNCAGCNIFRHGALDEYAVFMVNKYGNGILDEFQQMKHIPKTYFEKDLIELAEKYKNLADIYERNKVSERNKGGKK